MKSFFPSLFALIALLILLSAQLGTQQQSFCLALNHVDQAEVTANGLMIVADKSNLTLEDSYPSVRERFDLTKPGSSSSPVIHSEDDQLQTILRTFRKLPPDEIERFSIDLSDEPIEVGSVRAERLKVAWSQRQSELREAMKAVMKPAELMGNLTNELKDKAAQFLHLLQPSQSDSDDPIKSQRLSLLTEEMNLLLIDLESLLADVDNGRDFHTIGAWPTLVSFLSPSLPISTRAKAAWAIGTAMKNDYDYQLWTLETIDTVSVSPSTDTLSPDNTPSQRNNVTCLELLLQMFEQSSSLFTQQSQSQSQLLSDRHKKEAVEFQKRSIYALSSAIRGNIDVQDAIQLHHSEAFFKALQSFLSAPLTSSSSSTSHSSSSDATVVRKIFALIADLLDEREYIRHELTALIRSKLSPSSSSSASSSSSSSSPEIASHTNSEGTEIVGTIPLNHNNNQTTTPPSPPISHSKEKIEEEETAAIAKQLEEMKLLSDYFFFFSSDEEDWTAKTVSLLDQYLRKLRSYHQQKDNNNKNNDNDREREEKNEFIAFHQTIETILTIFSSYFRQSLKTSPLYLPMLQPSSSSSRSYEVLRELVTEIAGESSFFAENPSFEGMVKQSKELLIVIEEGKKVYQS